MRVAGVCSSYQDDCRKNLPAAPAADRAPESAMMDADKHQSLIDTDRTYQDVSKQHSTGPAAGHTQLLDPSTFTVYRPRARRLSEHGCGCCGLGLTLSDSPLTETPVELQAAWAAMPVIGELSEVTSTLSDLVTASDPQRSTAVAAAAAAAAAATPVTSVSAEVHPDPSAHKAFQFTSPFAGLTLSIPDDDQQQQEQRQQEQMQQLLAQPEPSTKHSSGGLSDAAAAALSNCQIVDDDGTPVPVFAIVSISFTKPANNPASVM